MLVGMVALTAKVTEAVLGLITGLIIVRPCLIAVEAS